jgi:murein DD-endopeptidase MepM/ murein hydrolase activator NlpD
MSRIILCILLLGTTGITAFPQPQFELSRNVYRLPYQGGIDVTVNHDHFSHDPQGRYDLKGSGNGGDCSTNYPIVAAAEGIIRRIVDSHSTHGPDCDENCTQFNNYVWIEHANGEWSKYTHLKFHSASVDAGLSVGDQVCAGAFLGYECDIGQASGPHLHFEVRHPNDPANVQISVSGGFMDDADHRIPVINSISKHYMQDGDEWVASSTTACTNTDIGLIIPFTIANNGTRIYMASNNVTTGTTITYNNGSNGLLHAGNSITLSPGFTAARGSYFEARIGNCATTNFPGGCSN